MPTRAYIRTISLSLFHSFVMDTFECERLTMATRFVAKGLTVQPATLRFNWLLQDAVHVPDDRVLLCKMVDSATAWGKTDHRLASDTNELVAQLRCSHCGGHHIDQGNMHYSSHCDTARRIHDSWPSHVPCAEMGYHVLTAVNKATVRACGTIASKFIDMMPTCPDQQMLDFFQRLSDRTRQAIATAASNDANFDEAAQWADVRPRPSDAASSMAHRLELDWGSTSRSAAINSSTPAGGVNTRPGPHVARRFKPSWIPAAVDYSEYRPEVFNVSQLGRPNLEAMKESASRVDRLSTAGEFQTAYEEMVETTITGLERHYGGKKICFDPLYRRVLKKHPLLPQYFEDHLGHYIVGVEESERLAALDLPVDRVTLKAAVGLHPDADFDRGLDRQERVFVLPDKDLRGRTVAIAGAVDGAEVCTPEHMGASLARYDHWGARPIGITNDRARELAAEIERRFPHLVQGHRLTPFQALKRATVEKYAAGAALEGARCERNLHTRFFTPQRFLDDVGKAASECKPLRRRVDFGEVWEAVDNWLNEVWTTGNVPLGLSHTFPKRFAIMRSKLSRNLGAIRTIIAPSIPHLMLGATWTQSLNKRFASTHASTDFKVGMPLVGSELINQVARPLERFKRIFSVDFTAADSKPRPDLVRVGHHLRAAGLVESVPNDLALEWFEALSIMRAKGIIIDITEGTAYPKRTSDGGTGTDEVTAKNCIMCWSSIMEAVSSLTGMSLSELEPHIKLIVYGDDIIGGTNLSELELDLDKVCQYAEEVHGMSVKIEFTGKSLIGAPFLKKVFADAREHSSCFETAEIATADYAVLQDAPSLLSKLVLLLEKRSVESVYERVRGHMMLCAHYPKTHDVLKTLALKLQRSIQSRGKAASRWVGKRPVPSYAFVVKENYRKRDVSEQYQQDCWDRLNSWYTYWAPKWVMGLARWADILGLSALATDGEPLPPLQSLTDGADALATAICIRFNESSSLEALACAVRAHPLGSVIPIRVIIEIRCSSVFQWILADQNAVAQVLAQEQRAIAYSIAIASGFDAAANSKLLRLPAFAYRALSADSTGTLSAVKFVATTERGECPVSLRNATSSDPAMAFKLMAVAAAGMNHGHLSQVRIPEPALQTIAEGLLHLDNLLPRGANLGPAQVMQGEGPTESQARLVSAWLESTIGTDAGLLGVNHCTLTTAVSAAMLLRDNGLGTTCIEVIPSTPTQLADPNFTGYEVCGVDGGLEMLFVLSAHRPMNRRVLDMVASAGIVVLVSPGHLGVWESWLDPGAILDAGFSRPPANDFQFMDAHHTFLAAATALDDGLIVAVMGDLPDQAHVEPSTLQRLTQFRCTVNSLAVADVIIVGSSLGASGTDPLGRPIIDAADMAMVANEPIFASTKIIACAPVRVTRSFFTRHDVMLTSSLFHDAGPMEGAIPPWVRSSNLASLMRPRDPDDVLLISSYGLSWVMGRAVPLAMHASLPNENEPAIPAEWPTDNVWRPVAVYRNALELVTNAQSLAALLCRIVGPIVSQDALSSWGLVTQRAPSTDVIALATGLSLAVGAAVRIYMRSPTSTEASMHWFFEDVGVVSRGMPPFAIVLGIHAVSVAIQHSAGLADATWGHTRAWTLPGATPGHATPSPGWVLPSFVPSSNAWCTSPATLRVLCSPAHDCVNGVRHYLATHAQIEVPVHFCPNSWHTALATQRIGFFYYTDDEIVGLDGHDQQSQMCVLYSDTHVLVVAPL